jgi:hypothetical protein
LVAAIPVDLLLEGSDELLDEVRLHQTMLERRKDKLFEPCPADSFAVIACAALTSVEAGQIIPPHRA